MIPSRNPSRSATNTSPSKPSIFGKLFRRFSHSSKINSSTHEQTQGEPLRYPSPRPQKLPSHRLPPVDISSFLGPPCINERHLWTIYESDSDAFTVKVIRLARKPASVERRGPRSCLKVPTSRGVAAQIEQSTSLHNTAPVPPNQVPLQRVSPNSNAWALAMASPKPTSLTPIKTNAHIRTNPTTTRRGTRAKENVEVSAIRRRQKRNSRDDLFTGCHY
jgi:hypothetical protein